MSVWGRKEEPRKTMKKFIEQNKKEINKGMTKKIHEKSPHPSSTKKGQALENDVEKQDKVGRTHSLVIYNFQLWKHHVRVIFPQYPDPANGGSERSPSKIQNLHSISDSNQEEEGNGFKTKRG